MYLEDIITGQRMLISKNSYTPSPDLNEAMLAVFGKQNNISLGPWGFKIIYEHTYEEERQGNYE